MTQPHRYVAGAIDLGEIKARADAKTQQASTPSDQSGGAVAPFFVITAENLENEVLRRSLQIPVIVLIGSARAEGSEQLKTDLQELAEAAGLAYVVGYVDGDTTPEIAQALGVQAVPTVLAIAGGRPLADFQGSQPRANVEQWLNAVVQATQGQLEGLPDGATTEGADPQQAPTDPRLEQALAALNAGDYDAALALYDDVIAENPADFDEITRARANVAVVKRLDPLNRTADAVADAEADPSDVDKQLQAADQEVLSGSAEAAFNRLLDLLPTLAGEDKTRVKDRLLELFGLFEVSDSRVLAARTRLANALY